MDTKVSEPKNASAVCGEESMVDRKIVDRMKPWVEKNLFGRDRILSECFPASHLTDAHSVVQMLRKKRKVSLSVVRIRALETSFQKHCSEFQTVEELQMVLEGWRCHAQTVDFNANVYYDQWRAEGYQKKLGNDRGSEWALNIRFIQSGATTLHYITMYVRESLLFLDHGIVDSFFVIPDTNETGKIHASGGSQQAIARVCAHLTRRSRRGEIVADFGCGSGLSSSAFGSREAFVIGVDASWAMLESNVQNRRSDDVVFADLSQPLPFRPNVFDAAISVACIHYLCTEGRSVSLEMQRPETVDSEVRSANDRIAPLLSYAIRDNNFCYNFFRHGGRNEPEIAKFLQDRFVQASCRGDISAIVVDYPHQRGHQKNDERWFFVGMPYDSTRTSTLDALGEHIITTAVAPTTRSSCVTHSSPSHLDPRMRTNGMFLQYVDPPLALRPVSFLQLWREFNCIAEARESAGAARMQSEQQADWLSVTTPEDPERDVKRRKKSENISGAQSSAVEALTDFTDSSSYAKQSGDSVFTAVLEKAGYHSSGEKASVSIASYARCITDKPVKASSQGGSDDRARDVNGKCRNVRAVDRAWLVQHLFYVLNVYAKRASQVLRLSRRKTKSGTSDEQKNPVQERWEEMLVSQAETWTDMSSRAIVEQHAMELLEIFENPV